MMKLIWNVCRIVSEWSNKPKSMKASGLSMSQITSICSKIVKPTPPPANTLCFSLEKFHVVFTCCKPIVLCADL